MSKLCSPTNNNQPIQQEANAEQIELAQLAKALAHPARLRILSILICLEKQGGCLNNDLVAQLGLAQSTVSEHLRILKVAGFISAQATPPKMCYRINPKGIEQFKALFEQLID